MKHKIKIEYRTGDTFNSSDETDYLDIEWNDLSAAKKSLKAIEEHYHLYMLFEKEWNADKNQLREALEEAKKKDWFYCESEKCKSGYWKYNVGLTLDDGSIKFVSTGMWCGYFETLFGAEIESVDDGRKISFR